MFKNNDKVKTVRLTLAYGVNGGTDFIDENTHGTVVDSMVDKNYRIVVKFPFGNMRVAQNDIKCC